MQNPSEVPAAPPREIEVNGTRYVACEDLTPRTMRIVEMFIAMPLSMMLQNITQYEALAEEYRFHERENAESQANDPLFVMHSSCRMDWAKFKLLLMELEVSK
jgi:hypothetical protein